MPPDHIFEQSEFACATLNLACDPVGRLMVAMGIVSPSDKKRSGADVPHPINDGVDRTLSLFAFKRDKAIWEAKKEHIFWFQPELHARSLRLLLAESRQSVRRIGFAVWMRARAVADSDDLSSQSLSAGVGDQTAAGQALVVGMRRDNNKRPIFQTSHATGRTETDARRPRVRRRSSPQILNACGPLEYPFRRICQRAVGAGLAKISGKIPGYALDRVRTQEGLQPD